jgi:hypothetical protein
VIGKEKNISRREWFQRFAATMVTVCLLVCSGIASAQGNSDNAFARVKEVQERHTVNLMAQEGVVGTAVGLHKGRPCCILVFTNSGTEQVRERIPPTVEGHPVVVHDLASISTPAPLGL